MPALMVAKMVFILKHIWRGDCKNYTVCSYWNLNSSSASRGSYEALKLGHLVLGPRQGKVHTEFHPTSVTLRAPCGVYSQSLSEGWGFLMGIGELCDKMGSLSWEMWCWKKKKVSSPASCCCIFLPKSWYSVVRGTPCHPGATTNGSDLSIPAMRKQSY